MFCKREDSRTALHRDTFCRSGLAACGCCWLQQGCLGCPDNKGVQAQAQARRRVGAWWKRRCVRVCSLECQREDSPGYTHTTPPLTPRPHTTPRLCLHLHTPLSHNAANTTNTASASPLNTLPKLPSPNTASSTRASLRARSPAVAPSCRRAASNTCCLC